MSIAQKGSRKIRIADDVFIWKIRKRPTYSEWHHCEYLIPVQHIDGGQILLISFGCYRSGYQDRQMFSVTPSIIKTCILEAICYGWKFQYKLAPITKDCTSILNKEMALSIKKLLQYIEKEYNEIFPIIENNINNLFNAGEYKIALEILIDNIYESRIKLSDQAIEIAKQALLFYNSKEYLTYLEEHLKEIRLNPLNK